MSETPSQEPAAATPVTSGVTSDALYSMMACLDPAAGAPPRDMALAHLRAVGLPIGRAYPHVYRLPVFQTRDFGPRLRDQAKGLPDYRATSCPNAEHIADTALALPHRLLLGGPRELDRAADLLASAWVGEDAPR